MVREVEGGLRLEFGILREAIWAGPIRDQRGWIARYRAEYAASDDIEKSALSRKKSERQNAIEIVYNLILSRLSEEVKQLVEADSEYVAMRDDMQLRGPFELLGVVRRVVSTGITSDHVYQTMIGVKSLHEVRQGPKESVVAFVERLKTARDVFLSACPHGLMFVQPPMEAQVASVESLRPLSAAERTRVINGVGEPPPSITKVFSSSELTPVLPMAKSWITDAYSVRLAIMGLNERNEAVKAQWKARMLDQKGLGPTIPANLDELVQRVLQYEDMDRQFIASEAAAVRATSFGKARTGQASKSSGKGKTGGKLRKPADRDTVCFNCNLKGHYAADCKKPKVDQPEVSPSEGASSSGGSSKKKSKFGKKKKAEENGVSGEVAGVKATECIDDYYIDAHHNQFMLCMTRFKCREGPSGEGPSGEGPSGGGPSGGGPSGGGPSGGGPSGGGPNGELESLGASSD